MPWDGPYSPPFVGSHLRLIFGLQQYEVGRCPAFPSMVAVSRLVSSAELHEAILALQLASAEANEFPARRKNASQGQDFSHTA